MSHIFVLCSLLQTELYTQSLIVINKRNYSPGQLRFGRRAESLASADTRTLTASAKANGGPPKPRRRKCALYGETTLNEDSGRCEGARLLAGPGEPDATAASAWCGDWRNGHLRFTLTHGDSPAGDNAQRRTKRHVAQEVAFLMDA